MADSWAHIAAADHRGTGSSAQESCGAEEIAFVEAEDQPGVRMGVHHQLGGDQDVCGRAIGGAKDGPLALPLPPAFGAIPLLQRRPDWLVGSQVGVYNGSPEDWGDDWFCDRWRTSMRKHTLAIPSQAGAAGMPLLRMPAVPSNLRAARLGRQTHPPARVSAVRDAHDKVGAADPGLTALRRHQPTPPCGPRRSPPVITAGAVRRCPMKPAGVLYGLYIHCSPGDRDRGRQ